MASLMLPPAPRRPSFGRKTPVLPARKTATPLIPSSPHIAVGARVEAQFHGEWFPALIQQVVSGLKFAHVLFGDGMDATVSVSELRIARLHEGTVVEIRTDGAAQAWAAGQVRSRAKLLSLSQQALLTPD